MTDILVQKRDGTKEKFNVDKIHKVIEWAINDISGVNLSDIEINAKLSIKDGITSREIHDVLIESAANLISLKATNYQYVAARLLSYQLRKDVWGGKNAPKFIDFITRGINELGIYEPALLKWYSPSEINKLDESIIHERDFEFTYAGIRQLCDKYLIQNRITKQIHETPQFAYMMIAMTLFHNYDKSRRIEYVKRAYGYFSRHKINLPTPIMAGVRTEMRSFASCCLADVADSMDSIFATVSAIGHATARRYGIGLNMGRIRAINAPIRGGEVVHTGVIPFLKVFESTAKSCQQGGLRGGGGTVTYPIWGYEVEDVIQLKNNAGTDENRVRKLDYSISISRLFYDRFIKDENITLFSSHEVPELVDSFGLPEFDELYIKAEKNKSLKFKKVVSARTLFSALTKERIETGRIYILNVDHSNSHSPWLDQVKMSNLCVAPETALLTKQGHQIISYLENKDVEIWNGKQWSSTKVVKTGSNQKLLKVILASGRTLDCTEYHKWYIDKNDWIIGSNIDKSSTILEVRTKDLKPGQIVHVVDLSFSSGLTNNPIKSLDKIRSILDLNRRDDTYCVNEPLEHKAVFNGILTGNCQEVLHPTIPLKSLDDPDGEIGVCILAAINWLEISSDAEMEKVCDVTVRMLEELIDYQSYFAPAANAFATKRRSLGIGVTNLAAFLAKHELKYSDKGAIDIVDEWMEKQQFYLLSASNHIAAEKGACESFNKTKYAQGILPIDTYKKDIDKVVSRKPSMDWEGLRESIIKHGLRHSTLTALMPVESSSLIQNATNGIEPPRALLSYKGSKARRIPFLVPHADKWKNRYTLAFEQKDNTGYLHIAAALQKWTDMAISVNMYYNFPLQDSQVIKDMLLHYKLGGKTIYYINTNDGNNQNIEQTDVNESAMVEPEDDSCSSGACKL